MSLKLKIYSFKQMTFNRERPCFSIKCPSDLSLEVLNLLKESGYNEQIDYETTEKKEIDLTREESAHLMFVLKRKVIELEKELPISKLINLERVNYY